MIVAAIGIACKRIGCRHKSPGREPEDGIIIHTDRKFLLMVRQITDRLCQFLSSCLPLLQRLCFAQLLADRIAEDKDGISHFMQFHRDGVSLAIRHIRNETAPRNHNGKWLARLPVVKHSRQMASIGMVLHGFLRVQAGHQFGLSLLHKARQIIERIQLGVGLFRTALCLHEILVLCRGNGF